MSCYLRHLQDIFNDAGIVVTASNRKQIDRAIHQIIGTGYKNCPAIWRNLKQQILSDELKRQDFRAQLTQVIK